jgi:hypothetical protein
MGLDLAESFGWIVSELAAKRSIADSMHRIIDQCAAAHPHPDWQRLRALPYDDLRKLSEWFEQPFRLEPPTMPLRGLWFGIFNPGESIDEVRADFYISGSERFDANSQTNEWAVRPVWWPEHRYAGSKVMASIYRIAYCDGGLKNDAEYLLCLGYAALAVRELLNTVNPSMVFDVVGPVGVVVGFDSGDWMQLGRLTRTGLTPL